MLKTVLVGLGRIGWRVHLPQILSHDGFTLAGVADSCTDRLEEAKEKYGVSGYVDLKHMLTAEKPDLVVVATPTNFHKEHAILAMEHGADVLLDKPMACNLDEAKAIEAVCRKTGRKLMIYQSLRAVPEITVLKRILARGIIGDIFFIRRASGSYVRRNDWQTMKQYGGGSLFNSGTHYIDQLLYLTEQRVKHLSCHFHSIATLGDAEDVVKLLMLTENNITLDMELNSATAVQLEPWRICGRCGTVTQVVNKENQPEFHVKYFIPEELPERTLSKELAALDRKYILDQEIPWRTEVFPISEEDRVDFYDKCYKYFAQGEEPFVPLEQTVYLMDILQRCVQDAESH